MHEKNSESTTKTTEKAKEDASTITKTLGIQPYLDSHANNIKSSLFETFNKVGAGNGDKKNKDVEISFLSLSLPYFASIVRVNSKLDGFRDASEMVKKLYNVDEPVPALSLLLLIWVVLRGLDNANQEDRETWRQLKQLLDSAIS